MLPYMCQNIVAYAIYIRLIMIQRNTYDCRFTAHAISNISRAINFEPNIRLPTNLQIRSRPNYVYVCCAWILNILYFCICSVSVFLSLLFMAFTVHGSMAAPRVLLYNYCVCCHYRDCCLSLSFSIFFSLSLAPVCKSYHVRFLSFFFILFFNCYYTLLREIRASGKVGRETRVRRKIFPSVRT